MSNENMVGNTSEKSGVSVEELVAVLMKERSALIGSVVTKMLNGAYTEGEIKRFDNRENPFVQSRLSKSQCAMWEKFYKKEFGLTVYLSKVTVPDNPGGMDRVLVIAKGVTLGMVIVALRNYFQVRVYRDDLDAAITRNERDPENGSYAIRVRDYVEADEELKNLSADDVKARTLTTETLLERLIHELKYFLETGKHLDNANWTLCAGSRYADGGVPFVYWSPDDRWLGVDWCPAGRRHGYLHPRAVVS